MKPSLTLILSCLIMFIVSCSSIPNQSQNKSNAKLNLNIQTSNKNKEIIIESLLKENIQFSINFDTNNSFLLNVCVNYGGRQEIVKVAKELALKSSAGKIKPSEINEELFNSELLTGGIKDPELLIRTSGEKRISNFLLWQLAYSEIYISDVLWPDFNEFEFLKAIIDYQSRNRRFGGIESLPNESYEDSQCSS